MGISEKDGAAIKVAAVMKVAAVNEDGGHLQCLFTLREKKYE